MRVQMSNPRIAAFYQKSLTSILNVENDYFSFGVVTSLNEHLP